MGTIAFISTPCSIARFLCRFLHYVELSDSGAKGLDRSALLGVNSAMQEGGFGKKRSRIWLIDKSRMSREAHVRFREGLGVKFLRATRPLQIQ